MLPIIIILTMASPKVTLVHYKYKTYSNGKHPIMIRITANRKSNYIATGYSCMPENWDEQNNRLIETRSKAIPDKIPMTNAKAINTDLELKYNEVLLIKQQVSLVDKVQSSRVIKHKASTKYEESQNFMLYGQKIAKTLLERNQVRTSKNFTSVLKRLEDYLNGKALLFSDVDVSFLDAYKTYLLRGQVLADGKKIPGIKMNTLNYHFKTIRSILYKAMNESKPLISRDANPFNQIKIKYNATKKETLSLIEIDQIRNATLDPNTQKRLIDVRNYYLFSYNNAGIRISDLIQLKIKNIVGDRLHYEMGKTGHFKSIKLNTESLSIIKQYKKRNSESEDYLFPVLDNDIEFINPEVLRKQLESKSAIINSDLKKLAKAAELDKRLHFHSSRHSFANVARKKKADVYSISKALGHKSIKVTEMYLASFDEEALDETMEMVLGR
jgi:integrase